jgi:hypothetical protein
MKQSSILFAEPKYQRRAVASLPYNQVPGHAKRVYVTIALYSSISFRVYTQVMAIMLIMNTVLYDLR